MFGFQPWILLTNVWHEGHETSTLDRVLDGALEGGTVTGAFAAENFALAGAKFLKCLHVFIIYKGRTRTAFLGAESAAVLSAPTEFLANHRL